MDPHSLLARGQAGEMVSSVRGATATSPGQIQFHALATQMLGELLIQEAVLSLAND